MKKAKLLIPLCLLLLGGCASNNPPQSETPSESSTPAESSSAETSSSEPSSEVPSSSEEPSSEVPSSSEEPEPSSEEPSPEVPSSSEEPEPSSEDPETSSEDPEPSSEDPSSEEPGTSSEEPTPVEVGWYIVGEGSFVNGDAWSPAGGIKMTVNSSYEGEGTEYMALDVEFSAKDTWKLCSTNNEWISNGWETESGAIFAGDMELIDDGFGGSNVGVVVTSTYDIYFKDYENGTYSCWISEAKTASPVDPSEPSEPVDPSEPSEPVDPIEPEEPSSSEPVDPIEPEDPITTVLDVYFRAPSNWATSVNIYLWDEAGNTLKAWPGTAMESLGDGLYKYTYDVSLWPNVIFNDGKNQTANLISPIDPDNALYVYGKGWSATESDEEAEGLKEGWYIVGDGSFVNGATWNPNGGIYLELNDTYEGEGVEYKALDVQLTQGDEWKITSTDGVWVEGTYEGTAFNDGLLTFSGNVSVNTTGTFDIYFKDYQNGTYSVWVEYQANN